MQVESSQQLKANLSDVMRKAREKLAATRKGLQDDVKAAVDPKPALNLTQRSFFFKKKHRGCTKKKNQEKESVEMSRSGEHHTQCEARWREHRGTDGRLLCKRYLGITHH